jgi:hypothetical protein
MTPPALAEHTHLRTNVESTRVATLLLPISTAVSRAGYTLAQKTHEYHLIRCTHQLPFHGQATHLNKKLMKIKLPIPPWHMLLTLPLASKIAACRPYQLPFHGQDTHLHKKLMNII